jgi:hypothetical protein
MAAAAAVSGNAVHWQYRNSRGRQQQGKVRSHGTQRKRRVDVKHHHHHTAMNELFNQREGGDRLDDFFMAFCVILSSGRGNKRMNNRPQNGPTQIAKNRSMTGSVTVLTRLTHVRTAMWRSLHTDHIQRSQSITRNSKEVRAGTPRGDRRRRPLPTAMFGSVPILPASYVLARSGRCETFSPQCCPGLSDICVRARRRLGRSGASSSGRSC